MSAESTRFVSPLKILPPFFVAVTLVIFVVAFQEKKMIVLLLLPLLPLIPIFAGRIDLTVVLLTVISSAGLLVPGLFADLLLSDILAAFLVLALIVNAALGKDEDTGQRSIPRWMIAAMILLMVVTMMLRGVGFRAFDGTKIGGMAYVRPLLFLTLCAFSSRVKLTTGQWRFAVAGYCVMSLVPCIADLTYVYSHGSFWYLYVLTKPLGAVLGMTSTLQSGQGIFRINRLPGVELLILGLILFRKRGRDNVLVGLFGLLALAAAGLSGHRAKILHVAAFTAVLAWVTRRDRRFVVALAALGLVMALVVLAALAPHLPLAVQRSITWIPFAHVSREASLSAHDTTEWRLLLWRRAFALMPDYWLIGRGFAFETAVTPEVYALVGTDPQGIGWALHSHTYHSGPLNLLVDLGVLGLLLGTFMMVFALTWHYRKTQSTWQDPEMRRIHRTVFALFCVTTVSFYLAYGDMLLIYPNMLLLVFLMDRIADSDIPPEDGKQQEVADNWRPPKPAWRE